VNTTQRRAMAALIAVALATVPVLDASARGGFRGGGFSSRSFSRLSGTRSLGGSSSTGALKSLKWGSSSKPSSSASGASAGAAAGSGGSSILGRRGISGSRSSVSSQRSLYASAQKNGTLFSSRAEASQAFRSKYAKDYSSSFASEPASRPSYIPSSAAVDGRSVNIVYNQGLGGYGYLHPTLGAWMLFDALSDAAMLDAAMNGRGYYWGAPAYLSHGSGFLDFAFMLLVVLAALALVASIASRARRSRW
jgi:hypothetical protein